MARAVPQQYINDMRWLNITVMPQDRPTQSDALHPCLRSPPINLSGRTLKHPSGPINLLLQRERVLLGTRQYRRDKRHFDVLMFNFSIFFSFSSRTIPEWFPFWLHCLLQAVEKINCSGELWVFWGAREERREGERRRERKVKMGGGRERENGNAKAMDGEKERYVEG